MQTLEVGDTELRLAQEGGAGAGQTVSAPRRGGDTLASVLSDMQDETVREEPAEESFRRAGHEVLADPQQRRRLLEDRDAAHRRPGITVDRIDIWGKADLLRDVLSQLYQETDCRSSDRGISSVCPGRFAAAYSGIVIVNYSTSYLIRDEIP